MDRRTGAESGYIPADFDYHAPVLLEETISCWLTDPEGVYIDVTIGGGGHAGALLERLGKNGRFIGLDRDPDAIAYASQRLERFRDKVTLREAGFIGLLDVLKEEGVDGINGVLADLGISSHQINTPSKGFSYRYDGPLDMRMGRSDSIPAAKIINEYSTEELARLFRVYGEERHSNRIARSIDAERRKNEIATTFDLVEVVKKCVPGRFAVKTLSRIFQALRIEVNREVESLHRLLEYIPRILLPGGRAVIISYHSLEDRPVKQAFRFYAKGQELPAWMEGDAGQLAMTCLQVTKKPLRPGEKERAENRRARSAKLRVVEKK